MNTPVQNLPLLFNDLTFADTKTTQLLDVSVQEKKITGLFDQIKTKLIDGLSRINVLLKTAPNRKVLFEVTEEHLETGLRGFPVGYCPTSTVSPFLGLFFIFGFGHAILRVEDPRATVLYEKAKTRYPNSPLIKIACLLRDAAPKVLKESPKVSNPYPNVDAISGVLLTEAGFPYPEYFPVLFGLSRVVGIGAQVVYERCEARQGKGLPIVRPKYLFKPQGGES